jgi:aminoglycoside phosphotransferase (APT) family kinase protein
MRVADVRVALQQVDIAATDVVRIKGGSANWTYLVNGTLIVRFPRTDEVARATLRELELLPRLEGHVAFAVPKPVVSGMWENAPFFGYQRIDGRGLRRTDFSDHVLREFGSYLAQLHSFPVDQVPLGPYERSRASSWHDRYVHLWVQIEGLVLPELDRNLADAIRHQFSKVMEHTPEFEFCFVHNDLGLEHVLIDPSGHDLVGIIDFENAAIGDPAVDLAPISASISKAQLQQVIGDRDLGDQLGESVQFYRWIGSVHAILYGVHEATISSAWQEFANFANEFRAQHHEKSDSA